MCRLSDQLCEHWRNHRSQICGCAKLRSHPWKALGVPVSVEVVAPLFISCLSCCSGLRPPSLYVPSGPHTLWLCSYKCNLSGPRLCPLAFPSRRHPLTLSEVASCQLRTLPLPQRCSRYSLTSGHTRLLFSLPEMPSPQIARYHFTETFTQMSASQPGHPWPHTSEHPQCPLPPSMLSFSP